MESKSFFIPTLESTSHYIERRVCDVPEFQIFDFALEKKMNVLIEGDAGVGKTSSVIAYCAQRGLSFFAVPSNSALDFTQLLGGLFPDENGHLKWVDGAITQIVRNGGVLLINELNNAHKSLGQYLMSLADDRRSITLLSHDNETIRAHKDFLLIADQNPNYRYTQPLNEAWKDRFEIKLNYGYDRSIESKFIKSTSLLDLAYGMRSTSISDLGESRSDSSTIFETPVTSRILKTFEKVATGLSYDLAVDIFCNNFTAEERSSARMLLEANEYNIKQDLNLATN